MIFITVSESVRRLVARFKGFCYDRAVDIPLDKQIIRFESIIGRDEFNSEFLLNFFKSKLGEGWCKNSSTTRQPVQVNSILIDKVKKIGSFTSTNSNLIYQYLIIKRAEDNLIPLIEDYRSEKGKLDSLRSAIGIALMRYLRWNWWNRTGKIFFDIEILTIVDEICEEIRMPRQEIINYLILEGILKVDSE